MKSTESRDSERTSDSGRKHRKALTCGGKNTDDKSHQSTTMPKNRTPTHIEFERSISEQRLQKSKISPTSIDEKEVQTGQDNYKRHLSLAKQREQKLKKEFQDQAEESKTLQQEKEVLQKKTK